jgi:Lon-like ATP-dependent protease
MYIMPQKTISAIEKIMSGGSGGYLGLFLRKDMPDFSKGLEKPEIITCASDLYPVGTFAQIQRMTKSVDDHTDDDGNMNMAMLTRNELKHDDDTDRSNTNHANLLIMPHRRIDLLSVDDVGPPIDVTVSHWERLQYIRGEDSVRDDTIRALCQEVLSAIREVAQMNALFREQVVNMVPSSHMFDMNDPYRLADFAASLSSGGDAADLQVVLEEKDAELRLHKALVLLSKEREVSKLQKEISAKVEEKMSAAQRKYFLTEQLKSIKKELGMEKDDKESLIEKYRKKLAEYPSIPQEIDEIIESELDKLSTLEKNSSEFNVTRSYLDWLTSIPWGITTEENFDISDARRVLDRDHYGMDEVKETILQFIAVGKLKGSVQGKILCLAGPPGTGKTSIAESVAAALGRKFFRFSVGGLTDVSEIKGHRRTYVGAMPGKVINCLKSTGSTNPLVLIDEIDKLGRDHRGDPASALLEVLDPSQNSTFRDHFIDAPVDISKVLFMCTANAIDNIPGPLLDRMEVIRLSGYDVPEKLEIAEKYLVPKSMVNSGLMVKETPEEEKTGTDESDVDTKEQDKETEKSTEPVLRLSEMVPESLSIDRSALESLVRWYCREAGVRNLAKKIDKITRLLSLQVVAESEGAKLTEKSSRKSDTWTVSADNLHEYVGKPIFTSDRLYEKDPLPHGVVMGLAWTSMGGSALYIESQGIKRGLDPEGKPRGGGTLKVTGQLGDVMKESTQIAYTVARSRLSEIAPANTFFDITDIHIHVPEGATPKDGPSAGITLVTAMLSLALDRPIKSDLAMTGEVRYANMKALRYLILFFWPILLTHPSRYSLNRFSVSQAKF